MLPVAGPRYAVSHYVATTSKATSGTAVAIATVSKLVSRYSGVYSGTTIAATIFHYCGAAYRGSLFLHRSWWRQ